MNPDKLSSEEVPQRFAEWLLAMGCPAGKVPSTDKVAQMCRGQYYMVWRSLMEQVQAKDVIRGKRLQVFCDDVTLCQNRSAFNEKDPNVVVPEQLVLWRQHQEVLDKVADAEARVMQARQQLNQLMDKVSTRMCQRNLSRRKVEDVQRRVWLLRQVSEELAFKKTNLEETKCIANSLCSANTEDDLQGKLDKCIAILRRQSQPCASASLLVANPAASSSVVSNHAEDTEEQIASLVRCRGDALWTQLCERRAGLVSALAAANHADSLTKHSTQNGQKCTPQSVLAHTAALHCTLSLEAMKNRAHIEQTRARLAATIDELNGYMSGEACELLVVRCERAHGEARAGGVRVQLAELAARAGPLADAHAHARRPRTQRTPPAARHIAAVDKSIESTKDELKRLELSLTATERKVHSIKEVLTAVFNSFHNEEPIDMYRGVQLDFPQESIASLCQFYEERRERRRSKAELSLDLDVSDASFNTCDHSNPTFKDELRIYLKKFSLEKNRKLVIESGEKLWIFETLEACLARLYTRWVDGDVAPLLCPSTSLCQNVTRLAGHLQMRGALETAVRQLEHRNSTFDIDIAFKTEEEELAIDNIKKQIGENLAALQKSSKTLEQGRENLKFWQDDQLKKYISANRTVDGKSYRDYETFYLERLMLSV